jgi:hypothetical protein
MAAISVRRTELFALNNGIANATRQASITTIKGNMK